MRLMTFIAAIIVLGASCADPALEKRVSELETRVEANVTALQNKSAAAPSPADDQAAGQLLRVAHEAMGKGDYDTAKKKLSELKAKYGQTRAARSAASLEKELSVIGKPAGEFKVEKWYSNNKTTFTEGKATLVVFWEEWCPHCKREVPKIQKFWDDYNSKGLNVVGLTRITKPDRSSEADTIKFISESNLTYPLAKEAGELATRFGVSGIPAAAIVKDGKIVWRGNPARLNNEAIEKYL